MSSIIFFIILYRSVLTGSIFQPLSRLFLSSELFLLLPLVKCLGKPTDWRGLIIPPPLPIPFHLCRAACKHDIPDAWRGNLVSLIIT